MIENSAIHNQLNFIANFNFIGSFRVALALISAQLRASITNIFLALRCFLFAKAFKRRYVLLKNAWPIKWVRNQSALHWALPYNFPTGFSWQRLCFRKLWKKPEISRKTFLFPTYFGRGSSRPIYKNRWPCHLGNCYFTCIVQP